MNIICTVQAWKRTYSQ